MERLKPGSKESYEFTHLIAEAKSKFSTNLKPYTRTHDIIDTVEAFSQISFDYFTIPPVKIKMRPVLYILKRKDNYADFVDTTYEVIYSDEEPITPSEETQGLQSAEDEIINGSKEKQSKVTQDENINEILKSTEKLIKPKKLKWKQESKIKENLERNIVEKEETEPQSRSNSHRFKIKLPPLKTVSKNVKEPEEEKTSKKIEHSFKPLKKFETKDVPKPISIEPSTSIKELTKRIKKEIQEESVAEPKRAKSLIMERSLERHSHSEDSTKRTDFKRVIEKIKSNELEKFNNVHRVKEDIRNVINQFKKTKFDNLTKEVAITESKTAGKTKESIKKIIEEERMNLEREELVKIQEQIMDIIDTNPNIINKDLIKDRVKEAFVYNFSTTLDVKERKSEEKKPKEINVKEAMFEYHVTQDNFELKIKNTFYQGNEKKLRKKELSDLHNDDQTIEIMSEEMPDQDFISDETEAFPLAFTRTEGDDSGDDENFEKRLEAANKHIEHIIKTIDNIVENIVVHEQSESEEL